jgi:hypothetical protein
MKVLESLLPIGRGDANRRMDCQTVFRITLGYLRTKKIIEGEQTILNLWAISVSRPFGDRSVSLSFIMGV